MNLDGSGSLLDAFRRFQEAQTEAYDVMGDAGSPGVVSIVVTPMDIEDFSATPSSDCAWRLGLLCLIAISAVLLVFFARCRRGAHGRLAQRLFGGGSQHRASRGKVSAITSLSALEGVEEPAVVLFWSQGCPHCESAKPHFEAVAASSHRGSFWSYRADALERDAAARGLNIQGFPTFVAFRKGRREVARLVGNRGREGLESFVAQLSG